MSIELKIKTFFENYNKESSLLIPSLLRGDAGRIHESALKNYRFGVYYSEIFKEICNSLNVKDDETIIGKQISTLASSLHYWDDLIDKFKLPIKLSKWIVYNPISKIIKLNQLKSALKIDCDKKDLDNALYEIENYFVIEQNILKGKKINETVESILIKGNCDFYFYDVVFKKYVISKFKNDGEKIIEKLSDFCSHYLKLDLLEDHIADLEDDLAENNFNLLLWKLKEKGVNPDKEIIHKQLVESGIYDEFYELGKKFGTEARESLENIKEYKPLYQLLKLYLDGEVEGLQIFKDYNYFIDIPSEKRNIYKLIILKPHPWERVSKWT